MSCLAILSGYSKPCRDFQPGVRKFYITEHANIASYTESSGVVTAMTMASGKKFWLYEQEVGVANGTEAINVNRQNGTYQVEQTFNAKLNKRGADLSYSLRALSQQDVAIIEVEETGTMFVWGLVKGLALDPSTSGTGTAGNDDNGYSLVWKGNEPNLAPTISQSILDTIIV